MKTDNNSVLALQHSNNQCNYETYKDGKSLKSLWLTIPAHCHLKCPYCFASTNDPGRSIVSMSEAQYDNILREFAELGGNFVGIPGDGEPFHNSNWELTKFIVTLCDELNIKLAIFTTGDLIFFDPKGDENSINYQKIDFIKDKDVVLLIKYNHSKYEIQNKLVGDKNSNYTYLREKAIQILINDYHFNDDRRKLGLATSVMNENAVKEEENGKLEIINIFERTQRDNLIFDCDTILELGRGKTFSKKDKCVPPQIDLGIVFKKLKDAGAIGLSQGGTYIGNICCDRILHHLYIKANGDVFPCIGCSREDIESRMLLGNIEDNSLKELWNKDLRRKLAERRYDTLVGICACCENFQTEACYSCLGRCIVFEEEENDNKAFNKDGTLNTFGCIHHKPSTTTWLATTVDYIRTVLSYPATIKSLKEKGLENLWRPNKNLAFTLWQLDSKSRRQEIQKIVNHVNNPHDNITYKPYNEVINSRVASFSQKKHYRFSELLFPMNKVWDFVKDPNLFNEVKSLEPQEKEILIDTISQSFLSNIFLSSFKILYEKYDGNRNNILYTNFILFDNIREKYFYRSLVKNELDDSSPEHIKSLIISRWYENIKINGRETNFWTDYCYNLSASFRHELYGDYELKLGNVSSTTPELKDRTIDLTSLLEIPEITNQINKFIKYVDIENPDFYQKFFMTSDPDKEIPIADFINSKIFLEFDEQNEKDRKKIEKLKALYGTINKNAFYEFGDSNNKLILDKFYEIIKKLIDSDVPSHKNQVTKKLISEFEKERKKGRGTQFINYFIYLGIMNKVLGVNYYYLLHSTNFATINPNNQELMGESELRGIIKSSGILICTKEPIYHHFRAELKLFISSIFAPFDEFYFTQIYGKIQANRQFQEKIEAHRHTLLNLINGVEPYRSQLSDNQPYLKYGVNYAFIVAEDICSKKEDRDRIGKKLPDKPDKLLQDLCNFFKANISSTMKLKDEIGETSFNLIPIQRIDFLTIMYNLIHNAEKSDSYNKCFNGNYEYSLSAVTRDNSYIITIINPAMMSIKVLNFLNNSDVNFLTFPFDKEIKSSGGLSIIKRIILENAKDGWSIEAKKNNKKQETRIIIKIK